MCAALRAQQACLRELDLHLPSCLQMAWPGQVPPCMCGAAGPHLPLPPFSHRWSERGCWCERIGSTASKTITNQPTLILLVRHSSVAAAVWAGNAFCDERIPPLIPFILAPACRHPCFVLYFSAPQLPHLACFGHAVTARKLEVPLAKAARCVPGHPCCSTFWLAACQPSTVPFVRHVLQYIARGRAGAITNRACVHGAQDSNDKGKVRLHMPCVRIG